MKQVDPSKAAGRRFPESVVLIVTIDESGDPNVMPAGWSMFTSGSPRMIAVSIGLERHTRSLLQASEEFTVSFPSPVQVEDLLYCGSHSGAEVDKFAETELEPLPAEKVSTPILAESVASFECRKHSSHITGDHEINVGEVVAAHVSEDYPERVKNLGRDWGDGPERFKTVSDLIRHSTSDHLDTD